MEMNNTLEDTRLVERVFRRENKNLTKVSEEVYVDFEFPDVEELTRVFTILKNKEDCRHTIDVFYDEESGKFYSKISFEDEKGKNTIVQYVSRFNAKGVQYIYNDWQRFGFETKEENGETRFYLQFVDDVESFL